MGEDIVPLRLSSFYLPNEKYSYSDILYKGSISDFYKDPFVFHIVDKYLESVEYDYQTGMPKKPIINPKDFDNADKWETDAFRVLFRSHIALCSLDKN